MKYVSIGLKNGFILAMINKIQAVTKNRWKLYVRNYRLLDVYNSIPNTLRLTLEILV